MRGFFSLLCAERQLGRVGALSCPEPPVVCAECTLGAGGAALPAGYRQIRSVVPALLFPRSRGPCVWGLWRVVPAPPPPVHRCTFACRGDKVRRQKQPSHLFQVARAGVLRGDAGTECFEQEKPGATHFPYEETEVQRHEVLVTDAGTNWEEK